MERVVPYRAGRKKYSRSLQSFRNFYARFVVGSAGSSNERLIKAFATTKRERYVGDGPWQVLVNLEYVDSICDDPRLLYQDILIGLATDQRINNGQPTTHARCLAACDPVEGERVIHIGVGTGYYTAILASLVGDKGAVVAYEAVKELARRAQKNLRHLRHVKVVPAVADADTYLPSADVIYVSAGATHPPAQWLGALRTGGRLVIPLVPDRQMGAVFLLTRHSAKAFSARAITSAAFIACIGARDSATSAALARAFQSKSINEIRSLRLDDEPDTTAWCVGRGWWLSTASVQ